MPQEKMEDGAYCRITPQIRELTRQWDKNAHIDRQLYEKYDVKRGLRDATGRGVLTSHRPHGRVERSPHGGAGPGGQDHPPRHQVRGKAPGLCVYGRKIGGSGVPARFPPRAGRENLPDILKINA